MNRFQERVAFVLLLILGLAPRLVMISRFPTIPVSDYRNLIFFAQYLRDDGLISSPRFWSGFNIGLPLVLCGLFRLI